MRTRIVITGLALIAAVAVARPAQAGSIQFTLNCGPWSHTTPQTCPFSGTYGSVILADDNGSVDVSVQLNAGVGYLGNLLLNWYQAALPSLTVSNVGTGSITIGTANQGPGQFFDFRFEDSSPLPTSQTFKVSMTNNAPLFGANFDLAETGTGLGLFAVAKVCSVSTNCVDANLTFYGARNNESIVQGADFVPVPEPGTLGLLGLGLLGFGSRLRAPARK